MKLRILALVLALFCGRLDCKAIDPRVFGMIENDNKDDTPEFITMMNYTLKTANPRIITLREGTYDFKTAITWNPEWQQVRIVGSNPLATWPQHYYEGSGPGVNAKAVTRFKIAPAGLAKTSPWLDIETPTGERAGPMVFENIWFEREGAIIRAAGETKSPDGIATPCRGLQFINCIFSSTVHPSDFDGETLPASTEQYTLIYLEDQMDCKLVGCSAWGGFRQLHANDCDMLVVNDWHGGRCWDSILITGSNPRNPSIITNARVEAFCNSAINVERTKVIGAVCETGYDLNNGIFDLDAGVTWTKTGANRIDISGVDPTTKFAPYTVVKFGAEIVFLTAVDATGVNFYQYFHNVFSVTTGNGTTIQRASGIPFIMRSEECSLNNWTPNFNKSMAGLPLAVFFCQYAPTSASNCILGNGFWNNVDNKCWLAGLPTNDAQYQHYWYLSWKGPIYAILPDHTRVYDNVEEPAFNANAFP